MADVLAPILFACVLWWSTTAAAIRLNGLARETFAWTFFGTTIVLIVSFVVMLAWRDETTARSAYVAFAAGLFYWAWQDVSFYLGIVTGRRKERCPEGCLGWAHFWHAVDASLYHELAILVAAAAVFAGIWGAPNEFGLWTFCVLWWMHQSAKLNVFLGVTNLNTDFLPPHLRFLEGFFRQRAMNLLFPVSITVSTVATALLAIEAARHPAGSFESIGYVLLATLMALAVLEHWFLVVPLPAERLWKWAIVQPQDAPPCRVDVVGGVLGAGKTTYVRRLLEQQHDIGAAGGRTIVVANDFGELGIDASLLSRRGADVLELPNGCICCSLRQDLQSELVRIIAQWRPARIIIEPSGLADVAVLLSTLSAPRLLPAGSTVHVHGIFDASRFHRDFERDHARYEALASLSSLVVLNKADLVPDAERALVAESLLDMAPHAGLIETVRGLPVATQIAPAGIERTSAGMAADMPRAVDHDHHSSTVHTHPHPHTHGHFESWSAALAETCGLDELKAILGNVAAGGFGEIERLKGIAETPSGWVYFDVAGGRPSIAAFAAGDRERPRVMAIGTNVDKTRLALAFGACEMRAVQ